MGLVEEVTLLSPFLRGCSLHLSSPAFSKVAIVQ